MKNFEKIDGITLIALVITIIVLLILAGVTISTLTGSNGLIEKTSEAQFKTEIATYKEELDLAILTDEANTKANRIQKFNATSYNDIKKLIPSFNKKYENILIVEEDRLIYKGTDKTLYKMAIDMNLLSEDELLDDEIIKELQPFITEWTVSDNDSITLPILDHSYMRVNFIVNYGDGTGEFEVTSGTDEDRTHVYEKAGTYNVTIKGECPEFKFSNVSDSKDKITKIIQWGDIFHKEGNSFLYMLGINFKDCKNLSGPIPEPSKNSFKNLETMYQFFYGCENLNCEIPKKMFYNCHNVSNMGQLFYNSSITGKIPKDLFKYCDKVTSFESAFRYCEKLNGEIPEDLFINCTSLTNLFCTFDHCIGITGRIPGNLFKKNTELTNLGFVFGATGISGEIPTDLFSNNTKVISFENSFSQCKMLTGSIPADLFKNCTEVKNFDGTFRECTGLQGEIPEDLFYYNTKVESFGTVWNGTFNGCTGLTGSIPEKLFENCLEAKNFWGTFHGCTGLTGEIPVNLFKNNLKATNFGWCFRGCTNLTGNAPPLWERDNITNSQTCFLLCNKLENYNEIPSDWK